MGRKLKNDQDRFDPLLDETPEELEVKTKALADAASPSGSIISNEDWIRLLPVLEPLSRATSTRLEPLNLRQNDFVLLSMNESMSVFIARICTIDENGKPGMFLPSNDALEGIKQRIPQCHIPRGAPFPFMYELAATHFTALVLLYSYGNDHIKYKNETVKVFFQMLIARFLVQTKNAAATANFKTNKVLPQMPESYIDHPDCELQLAPYQKLAVSLSYGAEGFALFMQQGTGKTAAFIARMCAEARMTRLGKIGVRRGQEKGRMMMVLVVCPKQVRSNWYKEIVRFTTLAGKVNILRGGPIRRVRCLCDVVRNEFDAEFSVCISSYDAMVNTDALHGIEWDLVVLDEAHKIKNPSTSRAKAALRLRDRCERKSILTGTPITNSVMDLWSQLEFLGEGLSGFSNFKAFKEFFGQYADIDPTAKGVQKLVALKNIPLIQECLARVSLRITKEEADLNLPEKTWDILEIQLTPQQRKIYTQMQAQLAVEIEAKEAEMAGKGQQMTADHMLTMLLRLAQITSGFGKTDKVIDDEGNVIKQGEIFRIDGANPKIDTLVELLQEKLDDDPDAKTIVWSIFKEDHIHISEVLTKNGIDHVKFTGATSEKEREISIQRFNSDPTCRVILCNQQAASEGLTLVGYDYWNNPPTQTSYCDQAVFFSQNYSMVLRGQSEDRAHRRGTRHHVRITTIVAQGTIDEHILGVVNQKIENAEVIQDLKEVLNRILSESDFGDD